MTSPTDRLFFDEGIKSRISRCYNNKEKQNMNSIISTILIAVGVALLIMGVVAMDSFSSVQFSSDLSRFFTGTPTDKAVWMLIGGILALIAGGAGMTFRSHSART